MSEASAAAVGLLHMIYPYAGTQQYVNGTLAYIEQARSAGAAVLIAAPAERHEALRARIAADDAVSFLDTTALGRNPGRLVPAWQNWIAQYDDGRVVHGVNDVAFPSRGDTSDGEARYAEWLLNLAFAKAPAWSLLCPVDTSAHPAAAIEALTRCHPLVWDGAAHQPVADYLTGPYATEELPDPPASAERMTYRLGDLPTVRATVARFAQLNGLPVRRTRELTLAVSEVATNSIRYGGGGGTLLLWTQEDALVCELRDDGVITDPLVGQLRPSPSRLGGRGLWFVNQFCDLVQLRSAPERGTRVRLWIDPPGEPERTSSEVAAELGR